MNFQYAATRVILLLAIGVLSISILLLGCGEDTNPLKIETLAEPVRPTPTMNTEERTGFLDLSTSNIEAKDLTVVTLAGESDLDQEGKFSVLAPEAEKPQLLFFNSRSTDKPVYIGVYDPTTQKVEANETSTALALTLINPYLIFSSAEQRQEYLQAVRQNPRFEELVSLLQDAYRTEATTALDYDSNPIVFQVVVQLMKEAMESLSVPAAPSGAAFTLGDPPYIEDANGDDVVFINPRHVFYTAGVYPNAGNRLQDIVTISRKEQLVELKWGWPPATLSKPEETTYSLGDGYFHLYLTRGFDFSDFSSFFDPSTPDGLATIYNTGQAFLYIIDIVIGKLPVPPITSLPAHLKISWADAYNLSTSLARGDAEGFIVAFCNLLVDNSEGIALWIWQETANEGAHQFINSAASLLKNVAIVLKLLSFVNEQGPFIWDFILAPRTVSYYVTQQNGEIIDTEENRSPQAEFTFDPPAGIVGTIFSFDASSTVDNEDDVIALEFRWDWETDGRWDTDWQQKRSATHVYEESGSYPVTLEVKDTQGLIGSISHILSVGGGAGTATHIKLFRDNLPWDSNAMVVALEELGFTEGKGANTYEIIDSAQMGTVPLIPGEDLIIISNDQDQNYYNNYAASQIRFTNFVYIGGSMFWGACDRGWARGSISDAGITLPGNITITHEFDNNNSVAQPDLPLVKGLPEMLTGTKASHENFTHLPEGTIVYCRDTMGSATLIEFNLGGGWMIVTGQPLEHAYERREDLTIGLLLPRVISHFTGRDIPAAPAAISTFHRDNITLLNKPSHITINDILSTTWGEVKGR